MTANIRSGDSSGLKCIGGRKHKWKMGPGDGTVVDLLDFQLKKITEIIGNQELQI